MLCLQMHMLRRLVAGECTRLVSPSQADQLKVPVGGQAVQQPRLAIVLASLVYTANAAVLFAFCSSNRAVVSCSHAAQALPVPPDSGNHHRTPAEMSCWGLCLPHPEPCPYVWETCIACKAGKHFEDKRLPQRKALRKPYDQTLLTVGLSSLLVIAGASKNTGGVQGGPSIRQQQASAVVGLAAQHVSQMNKRATLPARQPTPTPTPTPVLSGCLKLAHCLKLAFCYTTFQTSSGSADTKEDVWVASHPFLHAFR
jgi:hypothetical protein